MNGSGLRGHDPLKESSASGRRQSTDAQQFMQTLRSMGKARTCLCLPGMIFQGESRHRARRAADRPRPELFIQALQKLWRRQHETCARAGQSEELAEGTQHNEAGARAKRREAGLGRCIQKGFVNNQPAVTRREPRVPFVQLRKREACASGMLGRNTSTSARDGVIHLPGGNKQHRVPGVSGVCVFGVTGCQHSDATGAAQ